MDGLTIGLTVGGIIIGALVTFFVSKHFFKKSINKKSLTPYLQFSSKLFSELEPELKESLAVTYESHEIENLTQAQFVIANDGDLPIRDIIEPLKLVLPEDKNIFSLNLLHVEPEGREISYEVREDGDNNIAEFDIPLLNSGEYFVFKILYQDKLISHSEEDEKKSKDEEYYFSITADNLQPKLNIRGLPYYYYEEQGKLGYDWSNAWFTSFFGVTVLSIIGVIFSFKSNPENLYLFEFSKFFNWETFGFFHLAVMILGVLGIISLIVTIIGIIQSISEITPGEKPKFKVPSKLNKGKRYYHPFEMFG